MAIEQENKKPYQPTEEEMKKAEETMTDRQKKGSEYREEEFNKGVDYWLPKPDGESGRRFEKRDIWLENGFAYCRKDASRERPMFNDDRTRYVEDYSISPEEALLELEKADIFADEDIQRCKYNLEDAEIRKEKVSRYREELLAMKDKQ